jgi:hypothetical protein
MTRLQKVAMIIALALCFAGAIGMEIWQSSGKPQPSASQPPTRISAAQNERKANAVEERHQASEEAIAYYTKWLMFFTAVLALATVGLGYTTVKQLALGRAEYISSHRPRIILRHVIFDAEQIVFWLVNIGDTPATIVESRILPEFVEDGTRLRPIHSVSHNDLEPLVFEGGESKELATPVSNGFSYAIKNPAIPGVPGMGGLRGSCYFAGSLVYVDQNRVKRQSAFRRRWHAESMTFVRLQDERDHEYAD